MNYLAIGADGENNVLQLVNQGVDNTDTQYTDYIFTIDATGVTKVYICLLKSENNNVQIGVIGPGVTSVAGKTG